nr:immunoglobulin light chain junction region [Macaca mulatta]
EYYCLLYCSGAQLLF